MKTGTNQFGLKPAGWIFIAMSLLIAGSAVGEGFRNPPAGTFDLGRAGGRIAQVDDASAVQHNPANLVDLTNGDFQLTPSVVSIAFHFQSSSSSESANTKEPWKVLPNFFASKPIANGRGAIGVGITVPYGLAVKWDTKSSAFDPATGIWFGDAGATPFYTRLTTVNFNPTLSWKLTDDFHVGGGLDIMGSDLEFKEHITAAFPNWWAKAYGTGFGVGGNLAATWQVTERQRLAVTFRAPMNVKYYGHFRQVNSPGGNISSRFESQIKYPTIISGGYGVQRTDTLRVESDVEWIEFSRFQSLPLDTGNNPFIPSQSVPQNWRDTYTAGIAGDWKFADHWVLRGGYQFYETPVPNQTFSPTIPDANQNVLTIGIGYQHGRSSFEGAYGYDFYDTRHVTNDQNPVYNGKYTFSVHLFSLAYHYAF